MDLVRSIIEGFSEYLCNIDISENQFVKSIKYTPLLYDYIDDDLDFDEAYYSNHLISNFERMLDFEIMNLFKLDPNLQEFKVEKGKMIFRDKFEIDTVIEYVRQSDKVEVCTRVLRKMNN